MMCKILIPQINEEKASSIECRCLFPKEKGCHKGATKTNDLLYRPALSEKGQNVTEKYSHGIDCQQKNL